MKNGKKRIALIFSVACIATLLFTIPAFACGNDYDYSKHGGFIHATQTKSWFGSSDGVCQKKDSVEQAPVNEQPVDTEPVQKELNNKTPDAQKVVVGHGGLIRTGTANTHGKTHSAPEIKENILKLQYIKTGLFSQGFNGITKQGQTATIYKSHNSNGLRTPEIRKMGHQVQHIYPAKVFENTISKGKVTPFITKYLRDYEKVTTKPQRRYFDMDEKHGASHFVPISDDAGTTKNEKPGIVKVRLYRPFSTSNSSSVTETLKDKISQIWQIGTAITSPIDGRYIVHPLRAIFGAPLIPEEERLELRDKQFMKIISLAPEINGAGKTTIIKILTGEQMVNRQMRTAIITQMFLKGKRLETATKIGGGQHQRVAIARLLVPDFL